MIIAGVFEQFKQCRFGTGYAGTGSFAFFETDQPVFRGPGSDRIGDNLNIEF